MMKFLLQKIEILIQANIYYQLKIKVSISLSRLVITHYSAVQIVGGQVPGKLQFATFSKGCSTRNN